MGGQRPNGFLKRNFDLHFCVFYICWCILVVVFDVNILCICPKDLLHFLNSDFCGVAGCGWRPPPNGLLGRARLSSSVEATTLLHTDHCCGRGCIIKKVAAKLKLKRDVLRGPHYIRTTVSLNEGGL